LFLLPQHSSKHGGHWQQQFAFCCDDGQKPFSTARTSGSLLHANVLLLVLPPVVKLRHKTNRQVQHGGVMFMIAVGRNQ
jgi:hypothetical protein